MYLRKNIFMRYLKAVRLFLSIVGRTFDYEGSKPCIIGIKTAWAVAKQIHL